MTDVIRWEDPAPSCRDRKPRTSKFQAAADALRARPGTWALLMQDCPVGTCSGQSTRIKRGAFPWGPAGHFEATVRGPAAGPCSLYVRYVGGPS